MLLNILSLKIKKQEKRARIRLFFLVFLLKSQFNNIL